MRGEQRQKYFQPVGTLKAGDSTHLVVGAVECQQPGKRRNRIVMVVNPQIDVRLEPEPGKVVSRDTTSHHHGRCLASANIATPHGEGGDKTLGHGPCGLGERPDHPVPCVR